jgi:hypothetical protein
MRPAWPSGLGPPPLGGGILGPMVTAPVRSPVAIGSPALESGDRMDRAEFHRRYELRPDIKKAELVEGVVFVASPVRVPHHSSPHFVLIGEFYVYRKSHPGVLGDDNGTWFADDDSEVQPDAILRFAPSHGGASHLDADGKYLVGAPELVAEVSASSFSIDMHRKRDLYLRAGVREYIAWETEGGAFYWWRSEGGAWVVIEPDQQGVLHSTVFEGLALDPAELNRLAAESSQSSPTKE